MKLNKCFQTVFDPVMKSAGFSRKGVLFYRVQGTMLQGIRLETTNPYFITFSTFPYWLYKKRSTPVDLNVAKGHWVQSGGMVLTKNYYSKDMCEQNMKDMENTLELVQNYVLPHVDRVKDENDYFQMILNGSIELLPATSELSPLIRSQERATAEIFLYNQYNGFSAMPVEEAVNIWHENRLKFFLKLAERNRASEQYIQAEKESYLRSRDFMLEKIESLNQQGFLTVYETMCAEMKQLLLEQLKIQID